MSTEYSNNLDKGNRVIDVETKRPGVVAIQPKEDARFVCCQFQGIPGRRRVDVMQLRLVVDGKPEDSPPIDGVPPELTDGPQARPRRSPAFPQAGALDILKARLKEITHEFTHMNALAKVLRAEEEKIHNAIKALEAP